MTSWYISPFALALLAPYFIVLIYNLADIGRSFILAIE